MSSNKMRSKKNSKILIVSVHTSKSHQFELGSFTKALLFLSLGSIFIISLWFGYNYLQYQKTVSHFNEQFQFIMSADDKDLSHEVQIKKTLIKTKAFVESSSLFISKASSIQSEASKNLQLPYSNRNFSDFLVATRNAQSKAQPASVADTYPVMGNHEDDLLTSSQRQEVIEANLQMTPTGIPVTGKIVKKGWITKPGIEIEVPYGTYAKATASGEVIALNEIAPDTFCIEVMHKNQGALTTVSRYLFCSEILVEKGAFVEKGQVIAKTGFYPNTTEGMLGYQLLINNLLVEP